MSGIAQPTPFTPALSDASLENLRQRLSNVNWPHAVGDDDWQYGVPIAWLQEMAEYWRTQWNWADQAEAINRWQHYRVEIDDIPIHYLHAPAANPDAPALILTHGWPWTFWDFKDVIGPLSDPASYGGDPAHAFNVVVPSLPGFGFSTPLTHPGVDVARVADLWVRLMTDVLGFDKFAAHGGDWGALITAHLAHAHADVLQGAHMSLTLIPGVNRAELGAEAFADDEQWMLARIAEATPTITSHVAVHRLDPQTQAFALMDSPIGTAAWIWERRRQWSDCNGDIETVFDRDHLCTTAALYWCTGAITSSMRIYYEHFNKPWPLAHEREPVLEAPSAFAVFPKDVVHMPRSVLQTHSNLVRYTRMPRGGHFGAAEQPSLLTEDLRAFFFDDLGASAL
jgi:pimeloyl-ACP methyl ester carboxylesterase